MAVQDNISVLIPRVRRAVDGPTADGPNAPSATSLTDQQIRALVADSISEIIFHTGGLWGHRLVALDTDSYGAPSDWAIEPPLSLDQATVVVAQAALSFFFHEFKDKKVQETISNPARSWSYQLSSNLLLEQMRYLRATRDEALQRVQAQNPAPDQFFSFLATRDYMTSVAVEPWVQESGALGGQQVDFRF